MSCILLFFLYIFVLNLCFYNIVINEFNILNNEKNLFGEPGQ